MPIILIQCVTLALAATVTMWLAPISLWHKRDKAGDLPDRHPSRARATQTLTDLHIRREGLK